MRVATILPESLSNTMAVLSEPPIIREGDVEWRVEWRERGQEREREREKREVWEGKHGQSTEEVHVHV